MVDVAAGPRGKQDVSVDLAASVLAICGRVRADLARQRPFVGHAGEQAGVAFAQHADDWSSMVMPAARDAVALAPTLGTDTQLREQLARDYADDLARTVSAAAAEGLDEAMDIQTARDVHPDVAWQRAIAGYGLAKRPMRSFITTALRTPDKPGIAKAAAPASAVQAAADRALLTYAGAIGDCEVQAWSTLALPEQVAKAFDPGQRRDEDGKWTETSGGTGRYRPRGEARTKEKSADGVDDLLSGAPADTPTTGRYSQGSRYGGQRYSGQRYGGQRYAEKDSRYGGESRYGATAPAGSRYQTRYEQQTPTQRARRHRINTLYVVGLQQPNETPRVETSGFGLYLPMSGIAGYYFDGSEPAKGGQVDFSYISTFVGDMPDSFGDAVQLHEMDTPWDADSEGIDIDDAVWDDLMDEAQPLWKRAKANPLDMFGQLHPNQQAEVFKRAGYSYVSPTEMREQMERNDWMRDMEVSRVIDPHTNAPVYYDEGLEEALADYVTWHEPGILGEDGAEFQRQLDRYLPDGELDATPIPGVMVFSEGLAEGDSPKDVRGQYRVKSVEYHSAMVEHGNMGTPPGKIAMRELHVVPERV